jgi:hypothetical protein
MGVKESKEACDAMIEAGNKLRIRLMVFRIIDAWAKAVDRLGEINQKWEEIERLSQEGTQGMQELTAELERRKGQVRRQE